MINYLIRNTSIKVLNDGRFNVIVMVAIKRTSGQWFIFLRRSSDITHVFCWQVVLSAMCLGDRGLLKVQGEYGSLVIQQTIHYCTWYWDEKREMYLSTTSNTLLLLLLPERVMRSLEVILLVSIIVYVTPGLASARQNINRLASWLTAG